MQIMEVLNLPLFCFIDDTLLFTANSETFLIGVEAWENFDSLEK